MNEAWKNIFNEYIKCYEAIATMETSGIIDCDEATLLYNKLLVDIISAMKTEVEE